MPQPLDLAVAGNGTVAALIDTAARVTWLCWPRLDGDPVFCALLDGETPQHGFADIELLHRTGSVQRYRRNTAIVETELADRDGNRLLVTDTVPRFRRRGRMFRPPMLVRRVQPLSGRPRIRLRIRPRFGWGAEAPEIRPGSNHISYRGPAEDMRVSTDAPIGFIGHETPFVLDRPLALIIGTDESLTEPPAELARRFEEETTSYWQEWVRLLNIPFEWQEAVIRAAIALKLCAHDDTGGIVAALTTSIPEAPGTIRNWDYRFCWLRDAFFTVQALNRLGATRSMEKFVCYLTGAVLGDAGVPLRPVYPLVPDGPMLETEATALAGFLGQRPVRIGNAAVDQQQNDAWGSVILAAVQMFFDQRLPRPGDRALFRQLETLASAAAEAALTPDAGIWEYRGRNRVHTFSAAMCWAAVDRMARVARHLGLAEEAARLAGRAAPIRAEILRRAWSEREGAFVESLDGEGLDAALLLLPEIGVIAPADPRFVATVQAIERHLARDGLLLRYSAPDDFGMPETAFVVCSFWLVDALHGIGREEDARALFERILSLRNHVGLLSEDVDPRTGQLWGNYPQTYSQVGLILSAMRLSRSWEEGFWRAW
ncbi:glycoside hydrolase family 15 protein [Elioraea sp. Yellowstone]|uniref:glycoside hydrolase family 15 protein n=1 Tax=Elioraea sp. Yellowstone TaxID=2592070 RepID=UPI00114ECA76|nr:glycoside hydrolase family 15 protein [Elioraea sp. Yellowstone]TQF78293.1 glycoside hydrolase family 15 protein [Elioraea sp. Yellowstone]